MDWNACARILRKLIIHVIWIASGRMEFYELREALQWIRK